MVKRVLVIHGSKYGSTKEIAEKIKDIISSDYISVDIASAKEVKDLSDYSAVIIGSAEYIGMWRKEIIKLIKSYEQDLINKKVWFFSSGTTGNEDIQEANKIRVPKSIENSINSISPISMHNFKGKIDPSNLNFFERWIINNVKAETGDFRDWENIETWADNIKSDIEK